MTTTPTRSRATPPLESGDRLTRLEFHRRYDACPGIKKAELIEGVVYVPSPLRARDHGNPHAHAMGWMAVYAASHPGVSASDNASVLLDIDNEPQPDSCLRYVEGGSSSLDAEGYIQGPPEFIFEVAASSTSIDMHAKKNAYRRNGVQEYAVWRVLDGAIDWWELQEGEYLPLPPDDRGAIHSRVFPGLRLNVAKMLEGDLAAVLAEQQRA
jgi:Uma2 family endonuclease